MKIFISWSGDTSQKLAAVFRDWLPCVLQCVAPYVSSEDIDKGARWSTDVAAELSGSSFGLLCVTRDNVQAPWLNFEAGALSKTFDKSRVCPFLFGMKRAELKGPLLQFQSTIYEMDDVRKLVRTVNAAAGDDCLDETRVDRAFEVRWPRLKEALDPLEGLLAQTPAEPEAEPSQLTDMVEEILELARGQQRVLSDPKLLLPPDYLEGAMRHSIGISRDHPAWRDFEVLLARAEAAVLEARGKGDVKLGELVSVLQQLVEIGSYLLRRGAGRRVHSLLRAQPDRLPDEGK